MADLSKILSVNNKETEKTLNSIDTGMKALIKITLKGQKEEKERGKKEEQQQKRQERRSPAAAIKIDKADKKKGGFGSIFDGIKKMFMGLGALGILKALGIGAIGASIAGYFGNEKFRNAVNDFILKPAWKVIKEGLIGTKGLFGRENQQKAWEWIKDNPLKTLGLAATGMAGLIGPKGVLGLAFSGLGGTIKGLAGLLSPLLVKLAGFVGAAGVAPALAGGAALAAAPLAVAAAGGAAQNAIVRNRYGGGDAGQVGMDLYKEEMSIDKSVTNSRGRQTKDFTEEQTERKKEIASIRKELVRIKEERDKAIKEATRFVGSGRSKKKVQDKDKVAAANASYEEAFLSAKELHGFQNGGPITVPGTGSGDKIPMMLNPGNFVLNRTASNFLRRQEGGSVPALLEPGELVYPKTSPQLDSLNKDIPRFQNGGEVSHQDTGSGYQPGNAKDSSGRPVVLSKGASDAFEKMMKDGGVRGSDVASSKRSPSKNAAVGGVPNSAHLGGNAIDIHGASKSWMISNSEKYGWKRNNYMADSWHWDYVGKGSGSGVNEGNDNKSGNKKSAKNGINKVIDSIGGTDMIAGLGGAAAAMALQAMGVNLFGGASPAVIGAIMGPALLGTITQLGSSLFGGGSSEGSSEGTTTGDAGGGANGVSSKNAKALLNAIADAEGTSGYANQGYNTQFTGKQFTGTDHPREVINSGAHGSDAAGRYQFLSSTWDEYSGGKNMSPNNQDIVAMDLVRKKRGVNLSDGLSLSETYKLGQEWASIEGGAGGVKGGSYGGQAKFSAEKFMSMYKGYGGVLQLQKGGSVPTMLEPGEMVFPQTTGNLKQLNSAVPRFQNGGSVMDPDNAMGGSPQVVVVQAPAPHSGNSGQSANNVQTPTAPALSDGPSMASISDIINRVSWSNVF